MNNNIDFKTPSILDRVIFVLVWTAVLFGGIWFWILMFRLIGGF